MSAMTRSNEVRNDRIVCRFRRDGDTVHVSVTDRGPGEPHGGSMGSAAMFEVPTPGEAPELRANVPMFYERACTHYLRVTVDEIGRVRVETIPPVAEVLLDDPYRLMATTLPTDDYDDGEPF